MNEKETGSKRGGVGESAKSKYKIIPNKTQKKNIRIMTNESQPKRKRLNLLVSWRSKTLVDDLRTNPVIRTAY